MKVADTALPFKIQHFSAPKMHEKDDDYFGKTLNTIQETSFT